MVVLAAVALMATACHSRLFDNEDDCSGKYYLGFVYDLNLKWADAFPSEVDSVNLYVFRNGRYVRKFTAAGDVVNKPGYLMPLDLAAGEYRLVAWCCGRNNEGVTGESFSVTPPVEGQTTLDEFVCSLNTQAQSRATAFSQRWLKFLYHGMMDLSLPEIADGKDHYYQMELTKDTNHIRIILQQQSDEELKDGDFEFRIEDANGVMAYDNSLLGNDVVCYKPWGLQSAEAVIGKEGVEPNAGDLTYAKGVIADLSTGRLMADHESDLLLVIDNAKDNKEIARIPLIQFALMSKKYYESAYGHLMEPQEFLDREDEFVFTFFLDDKQNWMSSKIYVHQWRVVRQETELGSR